MNISNCGKIVEAYQRVFKQFSLLITVKLFLVTFFILVFLIFVFYVII